MELFVSLLGGLVFSGIGMIAFGQGRKKGNTKAMIIGAALIVYPYVVPSTLLMYLVGAGLTAALYIFRE